MHIAPWFLALVPFAAAFAQSPQITGVLNFRDVGGIPTSDGKTVKPGLYFRSGELNSLSTADFESLAPLHIKYIFDLRTEAERAAAPTVWSVNPPAITPIAVGIDAKGNPAGELQAFFAGGTEPANAIAAMQAMTAKLAIDGAPAIGKILLALSEGEVPAIIHCTAGKDRTGIVTAVFLTLLGVSKDDVYKDYLASNSAVPAQMMRLRQAYAQKTALPSALSALPVETIKVLMGVDRTYLSAAFAAIDAKYGSFDAYAANGLKLTPIDIDALRKRFTY
jgi:protein-tyrosine phosphatase